MRNSEEAAYITPVNITIVAINIAVFFVLEIIGDTNDGLFMYNHGAMYAYAVVLDGEWYRLLTAAFLHFGIQHLANNMIMLVCLGSYLEHAYGKVRYAVLYLVCAFGSNVISMMHELMTGDYAVSAGASGAIFGVIGALLFLILKNRGRFADLTLTRFLIMLGLSLYYGITTTGVDNWAHLGGLIVGFLMGMIFWALEKFWGAIRRAW